MQDMGHGTHKAPDEGTHYATKIGSVKLHLTGPEERERGKLSGLTRAICKGRQPGKGIGCKWVQFGTQDSYFYQEGKKDNRMTNSSTSSWVSLEVPVPSDAHVTMKTISQECGSNPRIHKEVL